MVPQHQAAKSMLVHGVINDNLASPDFYVFPMFCRTRTRSRSIPNRLRVKGLSLRLRQANITQEVIAYTVKLRGHLLALADTLLNRVDKILT